MIMELRDQNSGLYAGEFAQGVVAGDKKRAKTGSGTAMSLAQQRRVQQQSSPSAQKDSYYLERLRSETHSSRSDYATYLKHWFTIFPTKNILIIDYREIANNPRGVLQQVVMHVGVREKDAAAYVARLSDDDVRQRVNAATNTSESLGEKPETHHNEATTSQHSLHQRPRLMKQMQAYLRPYATRFNALLREKGYSWRLNEYTAV